MLIDKLIESITPCQFDPTHPVWVFAGVAGMVLLWFLVHYPILIHSENNPENK